MSLSDTDWNLPPDEPPLAIGTRVGRYEVRGMLGSGACAVVYDAEHRATGRRVALKTLRPELAGVDVMQARFRREVRVLGALRAPNLVDAIDAGTLGDGTAFLVLERLEGPTLGALLEHGPLDLAATIEVMHGVLEALSVLHAEGIVHRDIKPENIVIHRSSTGPVVKLLDLGVCAFVDDLKRTKGGSRRGKLTSSGLWIGTPCYMSPEQVDGRGVDARTDVYGAGVVLYECLTGRTPFEGASTVDIVTAVLRRPVMPPGVLREGCPRELDALVLKAVARDPRARPQTAAELWRALASIAASHALVSGRAALALLPEPDAAPLLHDELAEEDGAPTVSGLGAARRPKTSGRAALPPQRLRWRKIGAVLATVAVGAAVALSTQIVAPTALDPLVAPGLSSEAPSPRASVHIVTAEPPFVTDAGLLIPMPEATPAAHASTAPAAPRSAWAHVAAPEPAPMDEATPTPTAQTATLHGGELEPEPEEWSVQPPARPFIPTNPYAPVPDGPPTADELFPGVQP